MPRIYIPNHHPEHDFSDALRFGDELVFLTEGPINRFNTDKLKAQLSSSLRSSKPEDYWLVSSLTILNIIGIAEMVRLHGTVKLLLLKNSSYVERLI